MTLENIKKSTEIWVTPNDIAPILGCNPQAIREQAKANTLPFAFYMSGAKQGRIKINRESFLNFMEG